MFSNKQVLNTIAGTPIGGGVGYSPDVRGPSDTDVTVTTRSGFEKHADDAGKKIWIPKTASIGLTTSMVVRAEVYSDRGINSSPGGLLYTTVRGSSSQAYRGGPGIGLLIFKSGAKFSGLRYRGPYHDHYPNPAYPGYIPLDSGTSSQRSAKRAKRFARGINIQANGCVVENCEIYGWPNQAINIGTGTPNRSYNVEIKNCYGHDCMMVGYGYVVDVLRGHANVHDCYFNATRHSIVGFGHENCHFTAKRNIFGPATYSHAVDMHCLNENGFSSYTSKSSSTWRGRAGGTIDVVNNVFLFLKDIRGSSQEGVVIRGVPKDRCLVEKNKFMHSSAPSRNPAGRQGDAWRQSNLSTLGASTDSKGYANMTARNNSFKVRTVVLPDGVSPNPGDDAVGVGAEPPRLGTQQTNREGKAQATRGVVSTLSD